MREKASPRALLRVLMIEDCEEDTFLVMRRLREGGFEPVHERVFSLDGMRRALDKGPWDLVISDHSMPQFSAQAALEELKRRGLDLPVIIVSGMIDPDEAVAAMKAGASDYIMKEDLTRFVPAVERELRDAAERRARRQAEEQFRQAQKMESIGRVAGGVAHDFNNLLTAIMGYCSLLLQQIDVSDPKHKDVQEIRGAADRAAALTRQLLAFSRRQVFDVKVLDLNAVVSGMEGLLNRVIGEDVDLKLVKEPGLGRVRADPGQIDQVIMNLVVNARDAMPQGGELIIETANAGSEVTLSVADNGIGMSDEVKSHLFEPFFTTKEKGKGTGLGLSTVFGIIEQSEGRIMIESQAGRGTAVRIFLPRVEADIEPLAPRAHSKLSLRGTETVLVVEDDERVRVLSRRILEQRGYTVLCACDGVQGLEIIATAKGSIDLLVTDVVMPRLGGHELGERAAALRPGLKVLYLSGYSERSRMKPDIAKRDYLQKPFTPELLAQKVRETLER